VSEQMSARLAELRTEFESGQARLRQLEVEQSYLRDRLLMVKGAIDVLEDLLVAAAETPAGAPAGVPADGGAATAPGNGRVPGAPGPSTQEVS